MKIQPALFALLVLVMSCTSLSFGAEGDAERKTQGGEPAAIAVMTSTATARVQSVDPSGRKLILRMPDGTTKSLKVDREVRNFDRIKAGDQVKATYMEELAVYLGRSGAPAEAREMRTVNLAPKGAKPGVIVAETVEIRAKVAAMDREKRMVTLIDPAGQTKSVKVSKNVNLHNVKLGDDVVALHTEAMAVSVEKP